MPNKISGADAMLKVLHEWGVTHIYGHPGGSLDSTMNALHNQHDKIKFIQVRHEEAGALAASASAKLTGKIGVVLGSAGPGAIHLLNGLHDAKADHVPIFAIIAQVPTTKMNIDFFQAYNEGPWFDNVACWNRTAMTAESIPKLVDEGIRQAYKHRGVATLILPKDLGWKMIPDTFVSNAANHVEPIYPEPNPQSITDALELIKAAKAPMVYFGIGAKYAAKKLKEISAKFKLPLVSSVLAKGIIEDTYPTYMGSTGRVAPKTGVELGFNTDLILWIGNDVPFSIFLFNPKAKVIQIDIDSEKLGKRHQVTVPILADSKKTLQALLKQGEELPETPFYKAALANKENWLAWLNRFKHSEDIPLRPEPVFEVLNQEASDQAIFTLDVGNVNINFARLMNLHDQQKWTTSGQFATMGYGVPAAIAAKTLYPDRDVYSLNGDGGFAMLMEEIITQVKYNLNIINIIFNNKTLGYIEAEQIDDTQQPVFGVDLPDTDWATIAKGMGAVGYTVYTLDDFKDAIAAGKESSKPIVIDVKFTREMPFTTEHMYLDPSYQDPQKVASFIEKYQATTLRPFSYFLKRELGESRDDFNSAMQNVFDVITTPSTLPENYDQKKKEQDQIIPDAVSGASEY